MVNLVCASTNVPMETLPQNGTNSSGANYCAKTHDCSRDT